MENLIHLFSPKMQDKFITCHILDSANQLEGGNKLQTKGSSRG